MSAKQKLLFVSPEPTWLGCLGSHQRMIAIIKLLSERYEVSKLAIGKGFRQMNPPRDWMIIDHVLADALKNTRLHSHLVDFIDDNAINVVYFNYYYFSPLARILTDKVIRICDIHDVQHLRAQSFSAANEIAPSQVPMHVELRELESFDKLVSINARETNYLERRIRTPIVTIPHIAPFHELNFKENRHPIIVASLAKPNQDGFRHILLPAIMGNHLTSTVLMAGGISVLAAEDPTGRTIPMGSFDKPADIYPYASIALAPLRFGGGLKIKVIEALVHGIPVAGSACAFDGIPELPSEIFYKFEASEELAGIEEFIAGVNPDKIREFAIEHYDPGKYRNLVEF